MAGIDSVLRDAVLREDVPFVVAMTANREGVVYAGAAGEASPGRAAGEDTLFRIYSMAKAITSLAAMMLIDRGRLDLETPVAAILPDFAALKVVDCFENGHPILRPPRTKATIRHLATHTSGLDYAFWNRELARHRDAIGDPVRLGGGHRTLDDPLMSDPGTRWGYGQGVDWLSLVVEAVDGRPIQEIFREEIFDPLGMTDAVFAIDEARAPRLASVYARGGDGRFSPVDLEPPPKPDASPRGRSLYATAPDFIRFLRLFLNGGALDGRRLLSEQALSTMLADQMNGLAFQKMLSAAPTITADFDPFPNTRRTHSFGFLRVEEDVPNMRAKGSQGWAGVLNTHYWFDPKSDVAAVLMTQSLPFVEPRYMKLYESFERAVYAG